MLIQGGTSRGAEALSLAKRLGLTCFGAPHFSLTSGGKHFLETYVDRNR